MDFGDFFSGLTELGGERRGWRSPFVIVCLVVGAGLGGWAGYAFGDTAAVFELGIAGGLFGWLAGMFLRGLVGFILIFVIVLAVMFGWQWMTGAI